MGVWGQSPQGGPGAERLVGGKGAKPPEAERFLTKQRQNLYIFHIYYIYARAGEKVVVTVTTVTYKVAPMVQRFDQCSGVARDNV